MPGPQELPPLGILTSLSKMANNSDSERAPGDLQVGNPSLLADHRNLGLKLI